MHRALGIRVRGARVRAGSWYRTVPRRHRRAPRGGDGPSSCRRVFVAGRRSLFFARWQAIALCVGIGGDPVAVFFGALFFHLVAGFFGNRFPMSPHLSAVPCRTSREPLSASEFWRRRRSARQSITRSGEFASALIG